MGVTVIGLVSAWTFMKNNMVIKAPCKDIGNCPQKEVYEFTLQGGTRMEENFLTASDWA